MSDALESRGIDRRSFLRGALGAAAVAAGVAAAPGTASAVARDSGLGRVPAGLISIQLYTLRSALGANQNAGFEPTMRSLADIGYGRVELAGYYGRTAAQLRAFLDSIGISGSSSHDGISGNPAQLETKIDNALTLGQRFMVVPYLNSGKADDWKQWADQMNAEAAAARTAGLRYGYHNHAHEFLPVDTGETPWEIFTTRLDPSLVHLEVDLFWAVTGGLQSGQATEDTAEDFAIEVIRTAPQRVLQYHVKDRDPGKGPFEGNSFADLGTGFIDFGKIFAANSVLEYIVENDQPDVTPLQTAQVGYSYLRNLSF